MFIHLPVLELAPVMVQELVLGLELALEQVRVPAQVLGLAQEQVRVPAQVLAQVLGLAEELTVPYLQRQCQKMGSLESWCQFQELA